jgi:transposase
MLGQYRQGHRSVRTIIEAILPGIVLSQGLISKIKARTARLLCDPYEALVAAVQSSTEPVHVDATSWRHCGINEYLLVMRVGNIVSYAIVDHQNSATISRTLGGRVHCLVVDRGLAITKVETQIKQYCLAHLIRNVRGQAEHPQVSFKDTDRLGGVYDTLQELFVDKHRATRGEISQSSWQQYGFARWRYIVEELEDLSTQGSTKKLRKFCKKLLGQVKHFRAYLRDPMLPMTNNCAEEALRNLVIARKLCFGSRSIYGKRWREALHSCIETLRRQGKSILDFLTKVIQKGRIGAPIPNIV